jgi:hypothetical protein
MQFIRRFLLVILAPIFVFLLYMAATDYGIVRIVGEPGSIKKILSESGIYNSVLSGLLDQAKTVSNGNDSTSLQNSTIKVAAEKTFTPQFIQTTTETVIDSLYHWLDGSTPLPDFKIDLTTTKDTFATNAGAAVTAKLTSLPACAPGTPVSAQDIDADTAICLPAGVSPQAAGAKVEQNIKNGQGFLDHPVISAASIKSQGTNQSIFEDKNVKHAPQVFQVVKISPYAIMAIAFLLAIAIIFLSATRRKGLRRVGVAMLTVGIFTLIFSYSANWAINQQAIPRIKFSNTVLQDKVRILAKDVNGKVSTNYMQIATAYTIIGAGLVAGTLLIKKGSAKKDDDDLEGEGQTAEDRIELKEPVTATQLADDPTPKKKPATVQKPKAPAPKPKPAGPKKIIIQ